MIFEGVSKDTFKSITKQISVGFILAFARLQEWSNIDPLCITRNRRLDGDPKTPFFWDGRIRLGPFKSNPRHSSFFEIPSVSVLSRTIYLIRTVLCNTDRFPPPPLSPSPHLLLPTHTRPPTRTCAPSSLLSCFLYPLLPVCDFSFFLSEGPRTHLAPPFDFVRRALAECTSAAQKSSQH